MNQIDKKNTEAIEAGIDYIFQELFQGQENTEQKIHMSGWLEAFQGIYQHSYAGCSSTTILDLAQKEAKRYYFHQLAADTDTSDDQVWCCFILSRGMLMSLGFFTEKPVNRFRPKADCLRSLLSVEALHAGHYMNVLDALNPYIDYPNGDYAHFSFN